MEAYEREISAYKEEVEKLMAMVLHDTSMESLGSRLQGGEAIPAVTPPTSTAQQQRSDDVDFEQHVTFQEQVPPEQEQGAEPPRTQEIIIPTKISLHKQIPQASRLIVAPPIQPQQQQPATAWPDAGQQQEQSRPALPAQIGMYVPSPQPSGGQIPLQERGGQDILPQSQGVLNPETGQVLHREIGQDSPVHPSHVIPQTGQTVPQPGQVVTSSVGLMSDTLQESTQQPVQAVSNQEDDTNIVSSTLPAEGVPGGEVDKEGPVRELKYKKKYLASVLNNARVKFELLEKERKLKMARQDIEELEKKLKEMENLLDWEKRRGEVHENGTTVSNKRRGKSLVCPCSIKVKEAKLDGQSGQL